jgi:hypothetical protein
MHLAGDDVEVYAGVGQHARKAFDDAAHLDALDRVL